MDQVRAKVRLKHCSLRTEQAYTGWIKRYILHFGKRHPRGLGASNVKQFLSRSQTEALIIIQSRRYRLAILANATSMPFIIT
ncbi:MAG: phage integrase N-terminal SAM-like domain-containing protein [Gammaproteobacteria bacterium]|nr:phage integrase N-terminal SAM-like domain-containing protein [Gammaproteobacteria bacterium]